MCSKKKKQERFSFFYSQQENPQKLQYFKLKAFLKNTLTPYFTNTWTEALGN